MSVATPVQPATTSFGTVGGGAYFTGSVGVAPFNPSGFTNYNPNGTFVNYNPMSAPTYGANQVVYAHYAPGSQTAPAATTAAAAETKPAEDPAKAAADKKAAEEKKAAEAKKAEAEKKPEPKTVTVQSGDSLSKIAAKHGTTWQKLYELNKEAIGSNPNLIHAGLKLKLP